MAGIVSKNLYELLGNDPEQDPDREPPPPTRVIDRNPPRSGKRETGPQAPTEATGGIARRGNRGGRGDGSGNERAFRDRDAGSYQNRARAPDDGLREDRHPNRAPRGGEHRGRGRGGLGGRGGRGGRRGSAGNMDRHDKSGIAEHPKQAAHGWGGPAGTDELADEKAGEAIAKAEEASGWDTTVPPPEDADGNAWDPSKNGAETGGDDGTFGGDGEPAEPEGPKSKSYEEYLAEQAEKKLQLASNLEVRKPNEGASKKFPEGKAFSRNEEEENYMAGSGGKQARYREKKEKVALDMSDVDPRSYLAEDRGAARGGRGGRGRGEGSRGRGEGSRGRGEGGRGGRGDFRGGRGRGADDRPRGDFRGGRGGRGGAPPRVDDNSAFPALS